MKHNLFALVMVTVLAAFNAQCQSTSTKQAEQDTSPPPQTNQSNAFKEETLTNSSGERMRYLLFVPPSYTQKERYPLVLWLHGGGSRGDDLKLLLAHGDQHGIGYLARADNQARFPSLIVAPQCPGNRFFSDNNSAQPTNEMTLVLEILDKVQAEYSVDKQRIYVMGISMGGYAAWDIVTRRPGMFAAAVPICGGGNTEKAAVITKTAIWAFHGDEDEMVDVSESRKMVAALKQAWRAPKVHRI